MLVPSLVSVLAAASVAAVPSAPAERWVFPGRSEPGSAVVEFSPRGVSPNAIRGVWVQRGHRVRRLSRGRLIRGLADGRLRIRVRGHMRGGDPRRGTSLVVTTRKFGEFDGYSFEDGRLRRTWERAYGGRSSIEATFDGGGAGFARTWDTVHWSTGDDVSYRIALLIPHSARWCYWNPVRWDNYKSYGSDGEVGGVRIEEGAISLIRARYGGVEEGLTTPVHVPRGRWFSLEVRQRLSDGSDATNELLIDGRTVAASTLPNSYGRRVDSVRFGAVNVAGSCSAPGAVFFDDAAVAAAR
jgi:hypothetical protein